MVPRFRWSEGTRCDNQRGERTTSRASFAPHRKQRKRRLALASVPAPHWRATIGPDIVLAAPQVEQSTNISDSARMEALFDYSAVGPPISMKASVLACPPFQEKLG